MLTLPDAIGAVLIPFAALFQNRTWRKAQVLLVGAILSPGQRTVVAALRVMALSGDRNYARYHHMLNRAAGRPLTYLRSCLGCCYSTSTTATVHWCSASTKLWSGVRGRRSVPWAFTATPCAPVGAIRSRPVVCAGFP